MKIPFFTEMEKSRNVLIVGAGGGFDVFCGLPIYSWLKHSGKSVHLANLSFSELSSCDGDRPVSSLVRVTSMTGGSREYFPEAHLSTWLEKQFGETPLYAIERTGAKPTLLAYQWLVQNLQPDTLILVDGGTDSLMRGDEAGLGTPQEDSASLAAAADVAGVARKFLLCLGFGVDAYHGVCHAQALESVSALIEAGGYLGAWSLLRESPEFRFYEQALAFASVRMPQRSSIVNSSIISAAKGWFGNAHASKRTEGSELFINPLMALYWAFHLDAVASRNLYLDRIRNTETHAELTLAIEGFRATLPKIKPWQDIPC